MKLRKGRSFAQARCASFAVAHFPEHQRCVNVKAQGNALGIVAGNTSKPQRGAIRYTPSLLWRPVGAFIYFLFLFPRALPWALTLTHLWCSEKCVSLGPCWGPSYFTRQSMCSFY